MKRNPSRLLEKEMPREQWNVPGRWPVSDALIDNTTDMQSVSRTRPNSEGRLTNSQNTTGPCSAPARVAGALAHGKPGEGGTGALGINAKLRATFENSMSRMADRFALQSVARAIIPKGRTAKCLRIKAFQRDVEVWKSKEFNTASYGGLQTCGSVWTCPVCSAKIAERRRIEIQQAMAMHRASGGDVHLLTLTAPHTRFDALEGLLERQGKALQGFLRDRKVKEVFKEMGYIGQIRGYEVTHGRKATNNGWHPHFHFLQFVMVKGDAAQLMDWKTRLYLRWDAYCQKAGLGSPSFQHGIDLRDGSFASNYVAKWGLEDEMTKGHIKKGKAGGETPFDLLRSVLADKEDRQAAALFSEFAKAFKGKRQLSWSNGLKAKFNLVEITDEELAEKTDERSVLLGKILDFQWRDVLKLDARSVVLELAARGGWSLVQQFLEIIDGVGGLDDPPEFSSSELMETKKLLMESI